MCQKVAELNIKHPHTPAGRLTVSVGLVSVIPGDDGLPGDLISFADSALYQAKKGGGNRYAFAPGAEGSSGEH
jgi:PleD family two-component response regulator